MYIVIIYLLMNVIDLVLVIFLLGIDANDV